MYIFQPRYIEGFDDVIRKDWSPRMEAERDKELQLLEELQACPAGSMQAEAAKEKLNEHNRNRFAGFTIVGDNVDLKTHARYYIVPCRPTGISSVNISRARENMQFKKVKKEIINCQKEIFCTNLQLLCQK